MVLMQIDSAVKGPSAQLQKVLDAVPQHMSIFEPDWTVSFTNQAAREYQGCLPAASHRVLLERITHPEDFEQVLKAHHSATESGVPARTQARVRGKDGTYR